jgi:hypothetical protein
VTNLFLDPFLGAVFGLAISAVLAFLAKRVQVSRAKRLWRLREPSTVSVVLSTSASVGTGAYIRKMTGLGQARALGLLAPSLTRAYGETDSNAVTLSVFTNGVSRQGDLILLGGPKNNEVTREVLHRMASTLPITMQTIGDEKILQRTADGSLAVLPPASTPAPSQSRAGYDYGYILRAVNCFNPKTSVTVFAGTHTYGTAAAVRYFLDNPKKFRSLGDRQYALVVKVRVMGDEFIESPELLLGPSEF